MKEPAERKPGARFVAMALAAVVAGCVTPPRAVGPTTLSGPLPNPVAGAAAGAARTPGSTDGPLRVLEPRFTWTHTATTESTYEWSCTVENPSDETFQVTVVVHLLDAAGRQVAATNQAFQLASKSTLPVSGAGLIEGEEMDRVASWRLEYWPQVAPRPIR